MSDVKWIKITTDMFDDEKIKLIEAMPDADSVLIIWIKLLTLAGKCNEDGNVTLCEDIPFSDEMLATIFHRPLSTIRLALSIFQKYQMIKIADKDIKIVNWDKHQNIDGLDKIRENTRIRVAKYRQHKKLEQMAELQSGNVSVTLRNALEKSRVDNNICASPIKEVLKKNVASDFEVAWRAYPNKLGKKQAEKHFYADIKRGKKLEDILKAIENYKTYIKDHNVAEQYIKHGSTFFNNWEDFLNYEPKQPKERCDF